MTIKIKALTEEWMGKTKKSLLKIARKHQTPLLNDGLATSKPPAKIGQATASPY